jgi:hypothetical protein
VWWLVPVISATQKAEIRRIVIEGQPRQKISLPHLNKNNQWYHDTSCNPSCAGEIGRRIEVQD